MVTTEGTWLGLQLLLMFLVCCLSSGTVGQKQDVEVLVPQHWLDTGGDEQLGLLLDVQTWDRAASLFPLVYRQPRNILVFVFNASHVIKSKRVEDGWEGVKDWMRQEDLTHQTGDRSATGRPLTGWEWLGANAPSTVVRGGASMYAVALMTKELPKEAKIVLVTARPPSDVDLVGTAKAALNSKRIQLTVVWMGEEDKGHQYLRELALESGGTFLKSNDIVSWQPTQTNMLEKHNLRRFTRHSIHVDSLTDLLLTIDGHVKSATLRSPSGRIWNGLDGSGGRVSRKVVETKEGGTWTLTVDGEETPYSITVAKAKGTGLSIPTKDLDEGWLTPENKEKEEGNSVARWDGTQPNQPDGREKRDHDNSRISSSGLDPYRQDQPAYLWRSSSSRRNGEQATRLIFVPEDVRLPTSVQVALGSTLSAMPGQTATIYFNVANNRYQPINYEFLVTDENNWILNSIPRWSKINGISAEQVKVVVKAPYRDDPQSQQVDIITLTAKFATGESVSQRAKFTVGQTISDSTSPSIWYSFNGDCSNTLGPDNCYIGMWGANVTIQDSGSGLLQINSKPVALQLDREFTAGTTDPINARFSLSCCQTKVSVTAVDTIGNTYTKIIDIEQKWLSVAAISAIVLGVILLIILIILIVALVYWCCKGKRRSLPIYPDH